MILSLIRSISMIRRSVETVILKIIVVSIVYSRVADCIPICSKR